MQYLLRSKLRLDNNFFVMQFSFKEICEMFEEISKCRKTKDDVDLMIEKVAYLNINESYAHQFFGNNSYFFKRIS